jgi:hypothetical protein
LERGGSVSEYERTQLFRWFEEHMGKERASTMMALVPPLGWGDVATRRDLELLEARLDRRIDSMATKQDLAELRADLQRTFVTWMFASQASVVAAVGVLLAVFR